MKWFHRPPMDNNKSERPQVDESCPNSKAPSLNSSDEVAQPDGEFRDEQSGVLSHSQLMMVFPVLALAHFTACLDQTSVTSALPAIASDLALGPSLSWVATSYLLATASVQLVNGRLSDIFGRKQMLLTSFFILALSNLACGFAQSPAVLFLFRTLSGLGGGSLTSLTQIIISDITTLQQRGKYYGFIGLAVSLGNGFGPLLGGVMTSKLSWRWALWYDVPLIVTISTILYLALPRSRVTGQFLSRLRLVDWAGLLAGTAAITLTLIPVSEGGSAFPWNSPIVIAMLTVGGVVFLGFLAIEWKVASLPIMPLHIFQTSASCNILLAQTVAYGVVSWGNLFHVPLYLQNVRGYSAITAGLILLPMVGAQGLGSVISGLVISKTGHYSHVITIAPMIWTAGAIAQAFYSRTTPIWVVCVVGFVQGFAIGGCIQPGLVALLAHSRRADRAVLSSLKNFLRTIGGTLGLAIAGSILNNVLSVQLRHALPESIIETLASSAHDLSSLQLSHDLENKILDAYMRGIRIVFIIYAPLMGLCMLSSFLIRDNGLAEKDADTSLAKTDKVKQDKESG